MLDMKFPSPSLLFKTPWDRVDMCVPIVLRAIQVLLDTLCH